MPDLRKPIPAPSILPRATWGRKLTLQGQMHLADSPYTFWKFMQAIRAVTNKYLNFASFQNLKQQDVDVPEKVKQETLAQCPNLGIDYVGAWPITYYYKKTLEKYKVTIRYHREHLIGKRHASPALSLKSLKKSTRRSRSPRTYKRSLSVRKASIGPRLRAPTPGIASNMGALHRSVRLSMKTTHRREDDSDLRRMEEMPTNSGFISNNVTRKAQKANVHGIKASHEAATRPVILIPSNPKAHPARAPSGPQPLKPAQRPRTSSASTRSTNAKARTPTPSHTHRRAPPTTVLTTLRAHGLPPALLHVR
ncbi:hypothetical protein C2E23DRAFT_898170 [Lenzites betulinus]|nr:hypothetical protein C2E23DRAFT_898170 [Lenzites betulinus]